jgi:hypothetical protein
MSNEEPTTGEQIEAIASDPASAEHIANQQAEFAESQAGYTGEAAPVDPATMSTEELYARGLAPYSDLTSPGGPWHGLPVEASQNPSHPQWAENQRWACVQGSFFAYTVDGTSEIGDQALNVRGYGIPTDDGAAYMRSISHLPEAERIQKCIEQGNLIAYRGDNIHWTLAG